MLKHYSHIRMEAKRRAVDSLVTRNRSEGRRKKFSAEAPKESAKVSALIEDCSVSAIGSSGRIRTYNPSVNSYGAYRSGNCYGGRCINIINGL